MQSLMMGFLQPVTNLRDYVSQNPPVVTFFLCLLSLAVSFICLSSYSYTHTLPNPDTTKDWNHLLSSLSELQLCVRTNASNPSQSEAASPVPSPLIETNTSINSTMSLLTTLHLRVPLTITNNSNGGSLKDFSLHTALRASQLHLGDEEIIDVTLDVLSGNDTSTCLTISAPAHLLPTFPLPPECPSSEKSISPIHVEATEQTLTGSQTCYSLRSRNDPTLTVMLTWEEQSLAVRHMLEVSLCLLGVCLILCVVACLAHSFTQRNHWNEVDLQNDPLIGT